MKYWQVLFLLLCCHFSGACQAGDSLPANRNLRQLLHSFRTGADINSPLFTGSEYEPIRYFLNEGIPFFQSKDWIKGGLTYGHIQYSGIKLKYDLVQDKLITLYADSTTELALVMEKVNSFDVGNHHFISMHFPSSAGVIPPDGIYDELYNGRLKILVKRESLIEESIVNSMVMHMVSSRNRYYLIQGSSCQEFSGKRSLVKLLSLSRGKANTCLRKQGMKFKSDPERSAIALVGLAEIQPH